MLSKDAFFEDETALAAFIKGMTGGSLPAAQALAAKFSWQNYGSAVDIGTAEGCLVVQVTLRHPHITALGFDRAPVKRSLRATCTNMGSLIACAFAQETSLPIDSHQPMSP